VFPRFLIFLSLLVLVDVVLATRENAAKKKGFLVFFRFFFYVFCPLKPVVYLCERTHKFHFIFSFFCFSMILHQRMSLLFSLSTQHVMIHAKCEQCSFFSIFFFLQNQDSFQVSILFKK